MSTLLRSNPVATIGHVFMLFLGAVGRLALFTSGIIAQGVRPPYYPKQIGRMIIEIGYYSLPVVGMTTLFTGAALALQSSSGFKDFGGENAIPLIVALAITRELGPVMAGLMVAGRIGAAFAAEIGTMRVTEQLNVYAGAFDIFRDAEDGTNNSIDALIGLEYRSNYMVGKLRANLGAFVNDHGAQYFYTGLGYDVFFDDAHAWVFTPNLAIGFYNDANGKNLGGSREYKSSLEFAYQWPDEQRLGIAIQHISNAEKYEQNPGTELLTIQYAMPIDVLSR
jgi:hypothetical protein